MDERKATTMLRNIQQLTHETVQPLRTWAKDRKINSEKRLEHEDVMDLIRTMLDRNAKDRDVLLEMKDRLVNARYVRI